MELRPLPVCAVGVVRQIAESIIPFVCHKVYRLSIEMLKISKVQLIGVDE
jgi:hypothetical protein